MGELAISKQVSYLGNAGIVKFNKDGALRSMEVEVELSYRSNHFWKLETNKKVGGDWKTEVAYKMTAEGYEELNKAAGLKELRESTFNLNGEVFTNPAIIVDSTGRKNTVYYKTTLYGYGPDGEIHFSPTLIHYNATDELISSILSKINYQNGGKGKSMGFMCDESSFAQFKKDNPYAIFIPTDDFGGVKLGIAVDVSNPEFLKLRQVHQEKINNLEKKIQTVAKRNAYRKHPATAVYSINPEKKFDNEGNYIDLVAKIKVMKWFEVDRNKEEELVKEYLENAHVEVENFKDIDPDKDEEILDDVVEVDAMEEFETPFDNEYEEGEEL